jgi:GNAT superfamily N-acetyltransferase
MADPGLLARYLPRDFAGPHRPLLEGMRVGPARAQDAEGIARLIVQRNGTSITEARARCADELRTLADSDRILLVAECEARVIAFGRATYVERDRSSAQDSAGLRPEGWYLTGLIVDADYRRLGVGHELSRRRLEWIARQATQAFYFSNSNNRPSIDLHARFGFKESIRDFSFPGVTFSGGGCGILYSVDLLDPAVLRRILR